MAKLQNGFVTAGLSNFLAKFAFGLLSVKVPGLSRTCSIKRDDWRSSRVVDAEFETIPEDTENRNTPKQTANDESRDIQQSLLDLAIGADPEISNLRIPFCDGENSIDTKLSFMAEVDGVQYAIGIPFDFPAAIALEKKNGFVENLSPDSDENVELMELMAQQLKESVGEDLSLVRSPRVLTIAGPLDKYTKNWKEELLPKSVDTDTLLNQDNEDIDSFLNFMKEELGEEEFTKTMNEEHTFDEEILSLFSIPGLGENEDDLADFLKTELMDISSSPEDDYADRQKSIMENMVGKADLAHDGVALKLVSYCMANGKRYSLVQLLKPVVLVAREIIPSHDMEPGEQPATLQGVRRFELLSSDELRLVSPRLEEVCRADLERLGWEFEED